MTEYIIRNYRSGDEDAIENITYRTGYQGEDLTGRHFFDDKHLLYLIFIYYYPHYEPDHCFTAVERSSGKIIGFICGTTDTEQQESRFNKTMPMRIFLQAFTFTIWRYPKTIINLLKMSKIRTNIESSKYQDITFEYPAHLHINLLPEYQRLGLGTQLIQRFENHLQELEIKGVHLHTTNYNEKAVPFYKKAGFTLVSETPMDHFMFQDIKQLTFAKKLSGDLL